MIDSKNSPPAGRDAQLVQAHRDELLERMVRAIREDGTVDPLPGVRLYRVSSPTAPLPAVFEPAFCVIAQGSKELYLGEESYRYDPYHYCVGTVELPIVSQIIDASIRTALPRTPRRVGSHPCRLCHGRDWSLPLRE